jgi:hypothetical protein
MNLVYGILQHLLFLLSGFMCCAYHKGGEYEHRSKRLLGMGLILLSCVFSFLIFVEYWDILHLYL